MYFVSFKLIQNNLCFIPLAQVTIFSFRSFFFFMFKASKSCRQSITLLHIPNGDFYAYIMMICFSNLVDNRQSYIIRVFSQQYKRFKKPCLLLHILLKLFLGNEFVSKTIGKDWVKQSLNDSQYSGRRWLFSSLIRLLQEFSTCSLILHLYQNYPYELIS